MRVLLPPLAGEKSELMDAALILTSPWGEI
jgi:hypothetical protein